MGYGVFARHGEDGVLQRLLHGDAIVLPLPADKGPAVIFEGQLETRHTALGGLKDSRRSAA
jgi:hypothetical protein